MKYFKWLVLDILSLQSHPFATKEYVNGKFINNYTHNVGTIITSFVLFNTRIV